MKFLYLKNLETSSVLTSPDQLPTTPMSNLFDTRLSSYVILRSGDTKHDIHIEFPDPLVFDGIGLAGHNYGPDATLTIDGVGTYPLPQRNAVLEVPETSLSSIDLTITDPDMPVGQQKYIGRLEIGKMYDPPDIAPGIKTDSISNSQLILSASRQAYGFRRSPYQRLSVRFPLIEIAERLSMVAFFQYVDTFLPFFLYLEEECIDDFSAYVILEDTDILSMQLTEGFFYTSSMTFSQTF